MTFAKIWCGTPISDYAKGNYIGTNAILNNLLPPLASNDDR